MLNELSKSEFEKLKQNFPTLTPKDRTREFENYTAKQISAMIVRFLKEGKSFRVIDLEVLGLDNSHGFQSLSVLGYLGLSAEHKKYCQQIDSVENLVTFLRDVNADLIADYVEINSEKYSDITDDDDTEVIDTVKEGRRLAVYGHRYERNSKNRQAAIDIHGSKCAVCGFDFGKTYGNWGEGYIEIHHVKPLFLNAETIVDPVTDLVPLCANCHRMIHRQHNQVLSIEELKDKLTTNGSVTTAVRE